MDREHVLTPPEGEEKQKLQQLLRSESFRLLLERVFVPLLEQDALKLKNPHSPRDIDQFNKGAAFRGQQILDYCTKLAGLPSLFTPHRAAGLNFSALQPPVTAPSVFTEEADTDIDTQETDHHSGVASYGSGRSGFPA